MASPDTKPNITVYAKARNGLFFPIWEKTIESIEEQGLCGQVFMLAFNGQDDQSSATDPGNLVSTPQTLCPEHDLTRGGDAIPSEAILDSSVTDTVLLSTEHSNAVDDKIMESPFNEQ